MKFNIKATNTTLTPSIEQYIDEALGFLDKITQSFGDAREARVEIGRSNFHHKKGEVFFAEVNLNLGKQLLRAQAEALSVHAAIDEVRDELRREVLKVKGKKEALFKRGARSLGKILKLSPFARFRKK